MTSRYQARRSGSDYQKGEEKRAERRVAGAGRYIESSPTLKSERENSYQTSCHTEVVRKKARSEGVEQKKKFISMLNKSKDDPEGGAM